jgi:AhpD family alkylhydroperoxidase
VGCWVAGAALADEPPNFMKQTYPEAALAAAWEEYKAVYNPNGALPGKLKQLIALGVAAQIPCEYCVLAHTKRARDGGATDAEIKEALAVASMVRKWSTVLNGAAYDMDEFKAEIGIAPSQ